MVQLVGYVDSTTYPGGGYWIIKNSWGAGWNGNGYGTVMYGNIERHTYDPADAINGAVYCTGAMGTATWLGGSGTWAAGVPRLDHAARPTPGRTRRSPPSSTRPAPPTSSTISGTAIAHGLTFNPAATGYTLSGGALTVTGSGITANESATINRR